MLAIPPDWKDGLYADGAFGGMSCESWLACLDATLCEEQTGGLGCCAAADPCEVWNEGEE